MLALFVKVPTKIRRFSADFKYSAALRITVCYTLLPAPSALHATCNKRTTLNKQQIMSQWQFVVVNIQRKMAIQAIPSHSRSRILGSVERRQGTK